MADLPSISTFAEPLVGYVVDPLSLEEREVRMLGVVFGLSVDPRHLYFVCVNPDGSVDVRASADIRLYFAPAVEETAYGEE